MTSTGMISLSLFDLVMATSLILLLAGLNIWQGLGQAKSLLIAASRTIIQLLLIGLVLKAIFNNVSFVWTALIMLVMFLIASREVMSRQKRKFKGWWGFSVGASSMFVSAFAINIFALTVLLQADPWYHPQYAIPILGMLLGNTMTSVALALERLTDAVWKQKDVIENKLMLGQTAKQAIADIRKDSMRSGLIPIINAMSVAGLVSLPGMMTGQILAGADPAEAVRYQIMIMFLIAAGTGFGAAGAVSLAAYRLFDSRHRLRLDRLSS